MARDTKCTRCNEFFTAKTVRRHLRNGCPSPNRPATKLRRAADAILRRLQDTGRVPHSPRPQRPSRHFHGRHSPPNPPPFPPRSRSPSPHVNYPTGSPELEHPDFCHDTPGAGPGPTSRAGSPQFAPCRRGVRYCAEDDNGVSLIDGDRWNGLMPSQYYAQMKQDDLLNGGGLKLSVDDKLTVQGFNFKVSTDISGWAYSKLSRAFPDRLGDLPMDRRLESRISKIAALTGELYHCCVNSCIAYTGDYNDLDQCPWCREPRYKPDPRNNTRLVARRFFQYIPIAQRLINMYRDPEMATKLKYRSRRQSLAGIVADIFDGQHYQRLQRESVTVDDDVLNHCYFSCPNDIALGLSTDGFELFKSRKQSCWPLILVNYNLPPSIRTRLEHILCIGVIPGPNHPKEIDTFLLPLIEELETLARGIPAFDSADRSPFVLHAYLLACFGDMPAVAKLMCTKGHNGKFPCRACNICGIRAGTRPSNGKTNYVPLSRTFATEPDTPQRYDPLNLPLRTHSEYIEQGIGVLDAWNDAEEDRRSLRTGIKGLSALIRVPGLDFPKSFPHDFMHAMFENVITNLIDIWTRTGDWADFGTDNDPYLLEPEAWREIGLSCAASGNTVPSAFGCRVPDLKEKRGESSAESTLLFATLLAPALLRRRFRWNRYYQHFIQLVDLIDKCIGFEVTHEEIKQIREGFAKWVQDFERLYYNNDPKRLRACTLPLHALLHVADDIEAMGPVWCYWAFPMERFCGALARCCMSRRFPYSSFNRRVLQVAQLSQIKLVYGLAEELELGERRKNIVKGKRYEGYPDLVFVGSDCRAILESTLQRKVAAYVSSRTNVRYNVVRTALAARPFQIWEKMQRLDKSVDGDVVGGDVVRGHLFLSRGGGSTRDASHVRFFSRRSRWRWDRTLDLEFPEEGISYGRAEMFIVIDAEFLRQLSETAGEPFPYLEPMIIAVVSAFPRLRLLQDANLVEYQLNSGKYAPSEIVDATTIDCLIGRVVTLIGTSYIAERGSVVGRMDMADVVVNPD